MRRLILVSLLLVIVVASTSCLARLVPAGLRRSGETEASPTTAPQSETETQPTNTLQPPPLATATPPPEPTPTLTTAPVEEGSSEEATTAETESGEAASGEASASEVSEAEASEATAAEAAVSEADVADDVVKIIWQWITLYDEHGKQNIRDPHNYVLVFYANGELNVRADCNTGHGDYEFDGDRLEIGPLAVTRMFCPKGSRSDQFLSLLSSAYSASVDPDSGNLTIVLEDETGRLVFREAGRPKVPPDCDPCDPNAPPDCNPKTPSWCVPKVPPGCGPNGCEEDRWCDPVDPHVFGLVGILWQWTEIREPNAQSDVNHPEDYVLVLHPGGTFNLKADCNDGSGTYTLDGDHLALDITAITEVDCGEDSLFDLFVTMLDDVETAEVDGGRLILTLSDGAGGMVFDPAGRAKMPYDSCDWMRDDRRWKRPDKEVEEKVGAYDRESYVSEVLRIDPDAISLDTAGLPGSWQARVVPATPYDASQPTGPTGLPEHIQITFDEVDDGPIGTPVIYIIPVEAYKQLWENEGEPGVSITVDTLQALLDTPPAAFPTAGMPVLPFERLVGTNDLAVQGEYISQGSLDGVRFVGRFAQSPTAVSNEGLQYIFQGFGGDEEEYLIAFFYPVATGALPQTGADISAADADSLAQNPEAYLEGQAADLNALSAQDWVPSLDALDSVIASLTF